MEENITKQPSLFVFDQKGELLRTHVIANKTFSLSGAPGSDVMIAELGSQVLYLRMSEHGASVLSADSNQSKPLSLEFGVTKSVGSLLFLLLQTPNAVNGAKSRHSTQFNSLVSESLLQKVVRWACTPTPTPQILRSELKTFLNIVIKESGALNGFIVLTGEQGFDLISSYGMSAKESQQLWEKMPATIVSELLRDRARILLPEDLRKKTTADSTTVFVKGIKSVAGFPALTEDRVYAIFYVGFENILTGLTAEIQHSLEHCADVLGNFVQKAALREQLETLKVLDVRRDNNYLPANRLMAGRSSKLSETYKYIARLSPVDIPVLITGETGTGKELVAQELHRSGGRSNGPFIVINAAALPENLIESELFGHKKGSFTGAFADKTGLIERSENGTLFIDEIGELPLNLQAKLLRVLQERSVTRIGESLQRPVNFRLITATHRNLEEMVANGTFREDLFYRIAGANLKTWPLRERSEDVTILANFFRKQFFDQNAIPAKEFSSDAQLAMESYSWPGNIRELQNMVSRACIMAEGVVIKREDLALDPKLMTATGERGLSEQKLDSLEAAKDDWMKKYITDALRIHGGKRSETAKALGIGERTLFRYLDQLHINN